MRIKTFREFCLQLEAFRTLTDDDKAKMAADPNYLANAAAQAGIDLAMAQNYVRFGQFPASDEQARAATVSAEPPTSAPAPVATISARTPAATSRSTGNTLEAMYQKTNLRDIPRGAAHTFLNSSLDFNPQLDSHKEYIILRTRGGNIIYKRR